MDKFRLMQTYVHVVRRGSFAAAAEQVGLSPTIVTRQVAQLEGKLGVRLLNRTTRRLSLTEIGQQYYAFCLRVLNDVEREEAELARLQKNPGGILKIAAPKGFASLHLGQLVNDFIQRYPNIHVSVFLSVGSIDRVNLVENGYDLAIHLSRPEDSSIIARKICKLHRVACAAPAHLERHGRPRTPDDLRRANCLVNTRQDGGNIWHFIGPAGDQKVKVQGSFNSNSVMVLRGAAIAGLGITLLPLYCISEDLRDGTLEPLLDDYKIPKEDLYVLYPYNQHVPMKVRLFIDFMVEALSHHPWESVTYETA